ncbi:hypothetical protein METP3_00183 [Methanosarcinales archaeon]|nr:hypothetical protein METP3_00183 [Methanosarcinales archaeon]
MSEYNQFLEYKPQIRKDKCTGELDSCSGEGMLNTEAIKNAPGLNPLRFVNEILVNEINEIQDENIKSDFADGEILKNPSGLNTLHPFEIHDMNLDRDFACQGFPATERTWRTSSGLAPLRPGSKINKIRVIE